MRVFTKTRNYKFNGPFITTDYIKDKSGVYCVTTKNYSGSHDVIDVGAGRDIKNKIEKSNNKERWKRNKKRFLYYSVYYCNRRVRKKLEDELKESFKPVCGL